ncbi:beta-class phenol-soluble modulin [Staphylococcus sp. 11261D007BR]
MEELFQAIKDTVTNAIGHDWAAMGTSIVEIVEKGVSLIAGLFGL